MSRRRHASLADFRARAWAGWLAGLGLAVSANAQQPAPGFDPAQAHAAATQGVLQQGVMQAYATMEVGPGPARYQPLVVPVGHNSPANLPPGAALVPGSAQPTGYVVYLSPTPGAPPQPYFIPQGGLPGQPLPGQPMLGQPLPGQPFTPQGAVAPVSLLQIPAQPVVSSRNQTGPIQLPLGSESGASGGPEPVAPQFVEPIAVEPLPVESSSTIPLPQSPAPVVSSPVSTSQGPNFAAPNAAVSSAPVFSAPAGINAPAGPGSSLVPLPGDSQLSLLETWDGIPGCGWYARTEVLGWWVSGMRLPPLVTESPAGTAQGDSGVLGVPGTTVLFGNETVNDGMQPGTRFTLGRYFGPCCNQAIEVGGFALAGNDTNFVDGSDGTRLISRPFLDATTGLEASQLVSFPGVLAGSVSINANSDPLWGVWANLRQPLCCTCSTRVDWLSGFRYLSFNEQIGITENLLPLDGDPGTNIIVRDNFQTQNTFVGVECGVDASYRVDRWRVRGLAKVAFGNVHNFVRINGSTTVSLGGDTTTLPGGLLTQLSNIGEYNQYNWILLPEAGAWLEYQIRPNATLGVGYNVIYWMSVVRPGDHIDRVVNPNQIPPSVPPVDGPERPRFRFNPTDLWVHGINLSLTFRF